MFFCLSFITVVEGVGLGIETSDPAFYCDCTFFDDYGITWFLLKRDYHVEWH